MQVQSTAHRNTTWYNPTDKVQVVEVLEHIGKHPKSHADVNEKVVYVFQPGDTQTIPSKHDRAIHTMSPDGKVIMGGLAPYLVKVGSEEVMHSALNLEEQAQKTAEEAKHMPNRLSIARELANAVPGKFEPKTSKPAK